MFSWIRQFKDADKKTKWFIFNWFIYGAMLVGTTLYCYARLQYVYETRLAEKSQSHSKP